MHSNGVQIILYNHDTHWHRWVLLEIPNDHSFKQAGGQWRSVGLVALEHSLLNNVEMWEGHSFRVFRALETWRFRIWINYRTAPNIACHAS